MVKKQKASKVWRGRLAADLFRLLGKLPLRANRCLGGLLGYCLWWGQGKAVNTCQDNIARCFPELDPAAQRRLVKSSIIETTKTAFECTSVWSQPWERFSPLIRHIDGDELFSRAAPGQGILMLVPHLGNWEILGGYLVQKRGQAVYMYEPTGAPAMDTFMEEGRTRAGPELAPTSRAGVSQVLKHLKKGGLVAILPDQVPDRSSGAVVPFFGQRALTMTLVHKLVMRTGCQVIYGFAQRVPGGFHFHFKPSAAGLDKEDEQASLAAMNEDIERLVRLAPEQYQWEYKRFRRVDEMGDVR